MQDAVDVHKLQSQINDLISTINSRQCSTQQNRDDYDQDAAEIKNLDNRLNELCWHGDCFFIDLLCRNFYLMPRINLLVRSLFVA
ncbi:MAG: hypothetical protein MHMPM18_004958 [Marteilia pararefringens]